MPNSYYMTTGQDYLSFIIANFLFQHMTIQVEDVRIKPILSSYRKRIPVTEGYVEVKDGGKWKQICDEEWRPMNSRVICGMFGFPAEKRYNARIYKSVSSAVFFSFKLRFQYRLQIIPYQQIV